jgi:hypothetical protein
MQWIRCALLGGALVAASACAITKRLGLTKSEARQAEATVDEDSFSPWPDWLALGPRAFEERVEALAAEPKPWMLAPQGLVQLVEALGQPGLPATRAAVLLAHAAAAGNEQAHEALLTRLERRAYAPSRSEAAGDIVAAAALAAHTDVSKLPARLAALAAGARPHPELDVRVECACVALGARRDEVVGFLLAVLRAETPAQGEIDWPRTTSLAWAKWRAADALAARAGMVHGFRPDASWQDQMDAADRIEEGLRGVR